MDPTLVYAMLHAAASAASPEEARAACELIAAGAGNGGEGEEEAPGDE